MGEAGIFCAIFCCKRVCFSAFWKIWCSICYLPHLWDQFLTALNSENDNDEGFEEVSEGEGLRFREDINAEILWEYCSNVSHVMCKIWKIGTQKRRVRKY